MRAIFLSMLVLIFMSSCKKETEVDENKDVKSVSELIKSLNLSEGINDEALRIYNDVQDPDYVIAIIDNPNFGSFSSNPQKDIYVSGKSESDIVLRIDSNSYTADSNGQWISQKIEFKDYYGKTIDVTLTNGVDEINSSVYVTKPILVTKLGQEGSNIISKENNTLTWTPDSENSSGLIAIYYKLYNDEDIKNLESLYKNDILLVEDNGSFNLDQIIDSQCHRIYFQVVSGNTVSGNINNHKYLFQISTYDHHEYIVR